MLPRHERYEMLLEEIHIGSIAYIRDYKRKTTRAGSGYYEVWVVKKIDDAIYFRLLNNVADDFHPLVLTDDLLSAFQDDFIYCEDKDAFAFLGTSIYLQRIKGGYDIGGMALVKYVHQLQNIYHMITGGIMGLNKKYIRLLGRERLPEYYAGVEITQF